MLFKNKGLTFLQFFLAFLDVSFFNANDGIIDFFENVVVRFVTNLVAFRDSRAFDLFCYFLSCFIKKFLGKSPFQTVSNCLLNSLAVVTDFGDNFFLGLRIHFDTVKVCLSVLGVTKTESEYNAHCKWICSTMIDTCAKWTALIDRPENNLRLWSLRKINVIGIYKPPVMWQYVYRNIVQST